MKTVRKFTMILKKNWKIESRDKTAEEEDGDKRIKKK